MSSIGIAIPVPEPFATQLRTWRTRFGDGDTRRVPPHVTLLVPTSVSDGVVPAVERHLESVAASVAPFRVRLSGSATFRPVSQVAFVTLAEGADDCTRLESLVRAGPLAHPRSFPYHPHVTVAHDVANEQLNAALSLLSGYTAAFEVHAFTLFDRVGERWRTRRRFPLTGGPT